MSTRNHHKDDACLDTVHNGTFLLDLTLPWGLSSVDFGELTSCKLWLILAIFYKLARACNLSTVQNQLLRVPMFITCFTNSRFLRILCPDRFFWQKTLIKQQQSLRLIVKIRNSFFVKIWYEELSRFIFFYPLWICRIFKLAYLWCSQSDKKKQW